MRKHAGAYSGASGAFIGAWAFVAIFGFEPKWLILCGILSFLAAVALNLIGIMRGEPA